MMKVKYYLCCLFVMLLAACAGDKGNYDYTKVDEITISGIKSSYTVDMGGVIRIPITVEHSIDGGEHNLSYLWEIDKKEVGTSKDLDYRLPATVGFGEKPCLLTVTDEDTGMKFFKQFEIVVVSPFNWGYYMLCEDENGNSSVTYMPVRTEDNELQELKPLRVDEISEIPLGSNPRSLEAFFNGEDTWTIICTTEKGEYPVIVTNNYTFSATTLINTASFLDKDAGYVFSPEYTVAEFDILCFITQGGLSVYLGGFLYRPSKHEESYYWSNPIGSTWEYHYICVFDEISKKYYMITPQEDIPEEGIIGDPYAYDKVLPITGFPSLEGHTVIGIVQTSGNTSSEKYACITADDNRINIFPFSCTDTETPGDYLDNEKFTSELTGADEKTKVVASANDWYFGVGNEIHTSPMLLPTLSLFMTIEPELGVITDIKLSANNKVLVAALYNASGSSELKGSLVYIDISTKEQTIYKNIMDRCVSLLSCNSDPYGWEMGDGK